MTLAHAIYWTVFGGFALLAAWLAYLAVIGRRSGGPHCRKCEYDMTGAPSLTCPECGHDAKTPANLHRRRRSAKRLAVVAVLLAGACWYSIHVRWRMGRSEPFWEAMYPTTCLVLGIYPNDDDTWPSKLHGSRWYIDDGSDTALPAWQLWLRAWVTYRHMLKAPPDTGAGHPAQPWVWPLTMVSPHSDFAKYLHGKVIVEHPVEGVRIQAMWEAASNDNDDLYLRAAVWRAVDRGTLQLNDAETVLCQYGPDQFKAMSDQQFLKEFRAIAQSEKGARWADASELYLVELLTRRGIDREAELARFLPEQSLMHSFLLQAAKRRLRGQPDAIKITLTADGTTVKCKVQNVSDETVLLYWEDEHAEDFHQVSQSALLNWRIVTDASNSGGLFRAGDRAFDLQTDLLPGASIEQAIEWPKNSLFSPAPVPGELLRVYLHFGDTSAPVKNSLRPFAEVRIPTTQRSRQDSNLRPAD